MTKARLRCFLAVELGDPVKELIRQIQQELKKSDTDVKWVKPENTHLTLKFFGDIDTAQIDLISRELDLVVSKSNSFEMETTGIGAFPRRENPRIIWLGCEDTAHALAALVSQIDTRLGPLGFEAEKKDFVAHITLGRLRSPRNKSALIHILKNPHDYSRIKDRIGGIALFKSTLSASGPVYERLRQFPFPATP